MPNRIIAISSCWECPRSSAIDKYRPELGYYCGELNLEFEAGPIPDECPLPKEEKKNE